MGRTPTELNAAAVLAAFLITVLELTEVVALVFALGADQRSVRSGAMGAAAGTAVVGGIALGFGAVIVAFPRSDLLWASAVVLAAFGVFLFRSTVRSYRRSHHPASASAVHPTLQFAGGFSVGVVETVEAVIVLLAIAAAGYGLSALVGAAAGGGVLLVTAAVLHDRIRRIKVPQLKLAATSLLFAFAVFWVGEAVNFPWPYTDLSLIPLFLVALALVRAGVWIIERRPAPVPVQTKS
ncbi:MAG TPA: hypothetical protein VEY07_05225 [Thermoplasmata archaeon]|nr:hypothetical protein [Thermoplasmata archaeon]